MNELMVAVIGVVSAVLGALLFPIIKGFIMSAGTKVIKEKLGVEVKNTYTGSTLLAKVKYDLQPIKFLTTSIRTLALAAAIAGAVYGIGFWRGQVNKPVHFNLQGKEATIKLNEHFLKILSDGTAQVIDKQGKVLKVIRPKDIPELERELRPMGFEFKPIMVMGLGVGTLVKYEAGLGVSVFKFNKFSLNAFITNGGAYVGPSYKLTPNFDALVGVGKDYQMDTRVFAGGRWKF